MTEPVTIIVDRPAKVAYALKVIGKLPVDDGEVWDVIVGRHISRRSNTANARLWLLHTAAAKHVGCSPEDMHEEMLSRHFGYNEVKMPTGVIRRIPLKRSSGLNKKEFAELMESTEIFYLEELGVFLDHDGSR